MFSEKIRAGIDARRWEDLGACFFSFWGLLQDVVSDWNWNWMELRLIYMLVSISIRTDSIVHLLLVIFRGKETKQTKHVFFWFYYFVLLRA